MNSYITIMNKMKRILLLTLLLGLSQIALAQPEPAFDSGEWFRFKMSYSGWMKAGNATLTVKEDTFNSKPVYHVIGKGWTTGAIRWVLRLRTAMKAISIKKRACPISLSGISMKAGIQRISKLNLTTKSGRPTSITSSTIKKVLKIPKPMYRIWFQHFIT